MVQGGLGASTTYSHIVLKLHPARRVQVDFLQGLPDDIVRLSLALLSSLDGSGFVEIALVVDVEFAKGIRQREDVGLLKLRKFPFAPGRQPGLAEAGRAEKQSK